MRQSLFALVSILPVALLAGCAEWPRFANLEEETDLVSTDDDPRLTILASWSAVEETEPDGNDHTVQSRDAYPLQSQETYDASGYLIDGSLGGASWVMSPHEVLTNDIDAECAGVEGVPLVLEDQGDYGGDLDFFVFDVTEDAVLCATVGFPQSEEVLGVDLLVMALDDCDLPESLVMETDTLPLGYLLPTSSTVEWSTPVAAGDHLAVLLTGYVLQGEDGEWDWDSDAGASTTFPYRLGITIVPQVEGEPAPMCPLLEEPS